MKKGFTLVEIMIVVAIIALLAAIAIPNLIRARLTANKSAAQATLRTISTAAETYATSQSGSYPSSETVLTGAVPPYLNQSYCGRNVQGYTYTCSWSSTMYTLVASPISSPSTGDVTYTITTGGVMTPPP